MKNHSPNSASCSTVPLLICGTVEQNGTYNGTQVEQGSLKDLANKVLERNRDQNISGKTVFHQPTIAGVNVPSYAPKVRSPKLAAAGYVWCLDCQHFNKTCTHSENPFRNQRPLVPRKCHWYTKSNRGKS